ncbi:PFAM Methyltransferase type [Fragilaria crotonensis]|nr:PFAM Methyltransferase type [Fragilaria crotonensis]
MLSMSSGMHTHTHTRAAQQHSSAVTVAASGIVSHSTTLRDSDVILNDVKSCLFDGNDDDDDMVIAVNRVTGGPSGSLERLLDSKYYSFQDLGERKGWYSPSAKAYDDCRPKYPDQILDEALRFVTGKSILEIGSGPGTATASLAERGYDLTCLEPNADFCAIARRRATTMTVRHQHQVAGQGSPLKRTRKVAPSPASVLIENISFEEASTEGSNFDAIVAATSMHWIPADVAFPKAAKSLKEGGCLVLLWNMMLTPYSAIDLEKIKQAHGLEFQSLLAWSNEDFQKEVANSVGDLMMKSGHFENLRTNEARQLVTYTAAQYLGLLSTYSFYMRLAVDERISLFERIQKVIDEDLGGTIELSYLSLYHVATKKREITSPKDVLL